MKISDDYSARDQARIRETIEALTKGGHKVVWSEGCYPDEYEVNGVFGEVHTKELAERLVEEKNDNNQAGYQDTVDSMYVPLSRTKYYFREL